MHTRLSKLLNYENNKSVIRYTSLFRGRNNQDLTLESLYHLLYICPLSRNFWADFEIFWSSISKEEIHLSLQDVILGITTRPYPLLNYLLLIAKMYVWDCRRNTTSPNIVGFKNKAQIKYETELFIARNTCNMEFLKKKWMDFHTRQVSTPW